MSIPELMSIPEFMAIRFISKLKVMVHQKWLRQMNNEYDSMRSSIDDDDSDAEILIDQLWVNSQRPPLIKRQSGELNLNN